MSWTWHKVFYSKSSWNNTVSTPAFHLTSLTIGSAHSSKYRIEWPWVETCTSFCTMIFLCETNILIWINDLESSCCTVLWSWPLYHGWNLLGPGSTTRGRENTARELPPRIAPHSHLRAQTLNTPLLLPYCRIAFFVLWAPRDGAKFDGLLAFQDPKSASNPRVVMSQCGCTCGQHRIFTRRVQTNMAAEF